MLLPVDRHVGLRPPRDDKQLRTSDVIAPQGHFVAAFSGSGASDHEERSDVVGRGNPHSHAGTEFLKKSENSCIFLSHNS